MMLQWLDCTYPDNGPAYLTLLPTVECWAGIHAPFAAISMTILVCLIRVELSR